MNFDRKASSNEELVRLYRNILLPRMIEEKMLVLLRQGRISKWFSGIGQEAIAVGATMVMQPEEWILPLHRNLGVFTARGMPLSKLFLQWQGSSEGYSKGRERSFHFGSREHAICGMISHLGPQLGVADGIALAYKLQKKGRASLVFSGDGGTSEGDFHEALNVASVWDLPVIFLVENNGYGLSTPVSEQYRCESLVYKAEGYGMEGVRIDGNNILTVTDTLRGIREYCIKYQRPYLVECMTFRMRGHEEASGIKYVPKELLEDWSKKDPVANYETWLREEQVLNDDSVRHIQEEIRRYIDEELTGILDPRPIRVDTATELADVYAPRPVPLPKAAAAPDALAPDDPAPDTAPDATAPDATAPDATAPDPLASLLADPYADPYSDMFPLPPAEPQEGNPRPTRPPPIVRRSRFGPPRQGAPAVAEPVPAALIPVEPPAPHPERRMIDAIKEGLRQSMERHDNLVLMGQDIAEYGGAFKITEGLMADFGKERVRNTPLCESAIVGCALGLSLEGFKSVMEMQFADFVTVGFNQIVNNLAKIHYRWGEAADVVIRMPTGAGVGAGPFHSQSNEAWFVHTPGLKVVYPSTPEDAKGLLIAAINDPNPVLYFEHKALYRSISGPVPEGYYETPIGKARKVREGRDLSIITYGAGVHWALDYAVANPGISFDILDLRTLLPLDYEAIRHSVSATGKVLLLHEDTLTGGLGAEIAAWIGEHCFSLLDAPVFRCASLDTPIPFNIELENNFLARSRLDEYVQKLMEY
jgi:pyruvate/2-oxoglutarate/acetoin dehydrogenase E1 component/TPP-dependent pyruvate/acetoin dehydrogenase alpha subunit